MDNVGCFFEKNNSMKIIIRYNVQGVQKYLVQITHPLELALLKGVSSKKNIHKLYIL